MDCLQATPGMHLITAFCSLINNSEDGTQGRDVLVKLTCLFKHLTVNQCRTVMSVLKYRITGYVHVHVDYKIANNYNN